MDKSTAIYNIRGCIGYSDYQGAMNWILRASSSLGKAQFVALCDSVLADLRERRDEDSAVKNFALSVVDLVRELDPDNDASRRRHFDQDLDAALRREEAQKLVEVLRLNEQRADELRRLREQERLREAEEQKRKQIELELLKQEKRQEQLRSAERFLEWAGHYSDGMPEEQMLRRSEALAPKVLSRKQHREGIRRLGLSIDDDHFLTNSYRGRYHRVTQCYRCKGLLDNSLDKECEHCGWIVCDCGACGCGYESP